jgi:hypothetical protein
MFLTSAIGDLHAVKYEYYYPTSLPFPQSTALLTGETKTEGERVAQRDQEGAREERQMDRSNFASLMTSFAPEWTVLNLAVLCEH